jgi:hypothetical protein
VSEDYRTALTSAIKEYESLGEQRRDIDKRLAQLAQTIGTLSKLIDLLQRSRGHSHRSEAAERSG